MLTEMCMMASGLMTKLTVLVYIAIWMEQNMRGTGKKINNTDKVLRLGLTVPGMKVNTCKAKSMEKASSLGLMDPLTTVNLQKTISKAEENTTGPMEENMTVYG